MAKKSAASNKKRKAVPLAPPPAISQSRKRARQVTTLFHKYTRQRDAATNVKEVQQIDTLIAQMGGRREYQRASQISTSFHSTSKWVLGCLSRNGWLHGIFVANVDDKEEEFSTVARTGSSSSDASKKRRRPERRPTRLLEVGAINTELLDAAAATATTVGEVASNSIIEADKKKYRMNVRSIDLHSMNEGIEEADFLQQFPVNSKNVHDRYDVIVCSMVLNCVTTPAARGEMISRLHHFLRPGGLVYLTIPKTCLNMSPYTDRPRFEQLLRAVGLEVLEHTKDSPKVAFFIGRRPEASDAQPVQLDPKWTKLTVIRRGKKYRNEFAVTLDADSVAGKTLTYEDVET